jgi:UDP-galactopyranose mutase
MLPRDGYTRVFEAILDHPLICVTLNQAFDKAMLPSYRHCFNSMPIDEYFEHMFGVLPYRSIRFHHEERPSIQQRGSAATINFTGDTRFTRETDWGRLPAHRTRHGSTKIVTSEEPCDYRDNNLERYYPVKTSDGRFDAKYRR